MQDLGRKHADWYRQTNRFGFKGNHVVYRRVGVGHPMLLIHGFPTAGCDYADICTGLDAHFDMIVPDLLDYGHSENPARATWHIHDQADMMEALLASLGVTRVHIVAHDVGDTVSQELVARQNDGVLGFGIESLVLMNGGILPSEHRPRKVQKLLLGPFGPLISRLMREDRLTQTLKEIFGPETRPDAEASAALWRIAVGVNGKPSFARRIRYMQDRRDHEARWVGALQETELRMLMINGIEDPISGAHVCDAIEQQIPRMDVVRLNGIGHFPPLEAPRACVEHILDFHGLGG